MLSDTRGGMNGGSNGGSKKVEPPETLIFQGVPLVEVAGFEAVFCHFTLYFHVPFGPI